MKRTSAVFALLALCLLVGVVSADTTVFYANTDSDGRVGVTGASAYTSFYTLRAANGNSITNTSNNVTGIALVTASTSWNGATIFGFGWSSNTSSLNGKTIDSVKFGLYGDTIKNDNFGSGAMNITIVAFNPGDPTVLSQSDWQKRNTNIKYSDPFAYTSWNSNSYNNISLTNLSAVNLAGYTSLFVTSGWDAFNTSPAYNANYISRVGEYDTTNSGTSKDPFLEVTWHTGSDTTPPEGITGLSYTNPACGKAIIIWGNPGDGDYDHLYTLKNNVPNGNISSPTATTTWNGLTAGSYTFSSKTVDASGNMNATWQNITVDISTTCLGPMGTLVNAATNLSTPTYDGSGQVVHPSVIYAPGGWNGYHYLMAITPYPNANDAYENPSMRYSNDMFIWNKIAGQPDPIIAQPGVGFLSDPSIFLNGSTLHLFSRYADSTTPSVLYYNRTTTTNGVSWTTQEQLTFPYFVRSASFLYNGTGWECWAHKITSPAAGDLYHFSSSSDGLTFFETGTISGISIGGKSQWHSEVKRYDDQYQLLIVPTDYTGLYYHNSTDGLVWVPSESNPVLVGGDASDWDDNLYKSSFIELNNIFYVIYGGFKVNGVQIWHVGYSSSPDGESPPSYGSAPVASFTSNKTSGTAPLVVGFTDTSTNSPDAWNYSFRNVTGNNTEVFFSQLQNPVQIFGAGNFSIKLNASNAYGYNITPGDYWVNVSVAGYPPVADFSENKSGSICAGEYIQFTDESTNTPTSWYWEFGDGNISTLQNPTFQYNIFGDSMIGVNFKATNAFGSSWKNKTDLFLINDCSIPVIPTTSPYIPNPIRQNRGQLIDLITWVLNLFRSKLV